MQKYWGTILMVIIGFSLSRDHAVAKPETRATVAVLSKEMGIIYTVGTDKDAIQVIECDHPPYRLNITNPQHHIPSDTRVCFSGKAIATPPLEDEWGNYFEVTDIKVCEENCRK
jgi:hypothetical protein